MDEALRPYDISVVRPDSPVYDSHPVFIAETEVTYTCLQIQSSLAWSGIVLPEPFGEGSCCKDGLWSSEQHVVQSQQRRASETPVENDCRRYGGKGDPWVFSTDHTEGTALVKFVGK